MAQGVDLRIHRRADGRLEFDDMIRVEPRHGRMAPEPVDDEGSPPMAFRLRDARVSVIDEPSGTRLEFADIRSISS